MNHTQKVSVTQKRIMNMKNPLFTIQWQPTVYYWVQLLFLLGFLLFSSASAAPFFTPNEGSRPLSVNFEFSGGDACDSFLWYFGEGNSSTEVSPTQIYYEPGRYYPNCTCEITGAKISYDFDYIMVLGGSFTRSDIVNIVAPKSTKVTYDYQDLTVDEIIKMGDAFASVGLSDYAADSYDKGLDKDSSNEVLIRRYAEILVNEGLTDEAISFYNRSIAYQPSPQILNSYGELLTGKRRYIEAIEAFNQSIAQKSEDAASWAGLGSALSGIGDSAGALSAFKQSLSRSRKQPLIWEEYGDLLNKQKNYIAASDAYGKAIEYGRMGTNIYYKYGTVLEKIGKKEEAAAALATAQFGQQVLAHNSRSSSSILSGTT